MQISTMNYVYIHMCIFIHVHTHMLCLVAHSCLTLCDHMDCSSPGSCSSVHGNSPAKNTGVGCHAILQGIFPSQGSNPGLPHCRLILYHLSHQGSPRILEWVAYTFSGGTSPSWYRTMVSCIAGGFLPAELPRKPVRIHIFHQIFISFFSITSLYSFLFYVIIVIQIILL